MTQCQATPLWKRLFLNLRLTLLEIQKLQMSYIGLEIELTIPKIDLMIGGEKAFEIIQNKLTLLFKDYDNIQINIIVNFFRDNFPFVKPSFINKITIFINE